MEGGAVSLWGIGGISAAPALFFGLARPVPSSCQLGEWNFYFILRSACRLYTSFIC